MRITAKITALLLFCSLLLTACGGESGQTDTTVAGGDTTATTTTEPIPNEPQLELPDKKYDYNVRVFMRDCVDVFPYLVSDLFVESTNGDVLNDAVYERMLKVSEDYGLTFELLKSSNYNWETDALPVILAQEDAYDIIACHTKSAYTYVREGCCLDWNTALPYVDLDKPWWDQHARENLEIKGFLGTMVGDLSHISLGSSKCLFFNKVLFDELQLEYPYQDVIDKKWTVDKFEELAKLASKDLNGDGKFKPEDDQFGYVTADWDGPIQAVTIAGGKYVDRDESGNLVITLMTERNSDVYERLFNFVATDNCYMQMNSAGYYNRHDVFKDGRALFVDSTIQYTEKMRDMKDDFGIIPCPMYDELCDGYFTNPDGYTNFFCVPVTAYEHVEPISVALEALSYYGNKSVIPAYYEIVLKGKYVRDDMSAQMLDIIKAGRVFDIGYYATEVGSSGYNMAHETSPNLSTYYTKNVKIFQRAVDNLNSFMEAED